jgi:hypothetical protein
LKGFKAKDAMVEAAKKKKVIVIGGGFGGVFAAKASPARP